MSLEESKKWFANICSALGHAHDHDIIHRDIKPSNIIITTSLQSCYLVDFGICLRKSDVQRLTNGTPIGTPGYMSPEQERGEDLGPESDIFSLGIVLYECLSGTKPTVGEYLTLNSMNDAIPPAIDDLIQASLRDRGQRLDSAEKFARAFEQALEPHASFSEVLSKGSLHEIQIALGKMTPGQFGRLPRGQRVLMFSRLKDLLNVDESNLRNAVAAILAELVRVAYFASDENYKLAVANGLQYGFEVVHSNDWQGNPQIRDALNGVALEVEEESHGIISEALIEFQDSLDDISEKQKWYYHGLRVLLQNLLANPRCADDHAERLGERLVQVNALSHTSTNT